jgi:hypothetical protein
LPSGTYINEELNQKLQLDGGYLFTPEGGKKKLVPRSSTEYYIHDLPVIIRFEGERIIIEGEQLCDRWTTYGTIFHKQS